MGSYTTRWDSTFVAAVVIWNAIIVAYVVGTIVIGLRPGVQHETTVVVISFLFLTWFTGNGALACVGLVVRHLRLKSREPDIARSSNH